MRIGILQCDRVRPQFLDEHGDYPDMFRVLLQPLAPRVVFEVFDVERGVYPSAPGSCDAYLITGSRASVFDDAAWIAPLMDYVRDLYRRRIRTVGVCFGHQLLAHALGGLTQRSDKGWGVGVRTVTVGGHAGWMQPKLQDFALLYSHQDQVTRLPAGATRLAGDAFCPNAMFELEQIALGCQGHPEFTPAYAQALLELRRDQIGEPALGRAAASLGDLRQHREVAGWLLRFLGAPVTLS